MKMRNENERILKKILYFDIFSILLLFIKPLASKNFGFLDWCGLQGLIFCVMKCCSTVGPVAIIMYTDWSTRWSKSDTDHNKCNIFSVTFSKILSIKCHLIFQFTGCWNNPSTSFLCILNSLQIGSFVHFPCNTKKSSYWAGWAKQSWFWLVSGRCLVWILAWTVLALTEDVGGYVQSFQANYLIVPAVRP